MHWYFFVDKMREAFALQKLLAFFQQKYRQISDIKVWNFNETLTNGVVSFEQPGPDLFRSSLTSRLFAMDSTSIFF